MNQAPVTSDRSIFLILMDNKTLRKKYSWKKRRAVSRGILFRLSFSEFRELSRIRRCQYTGRFLSFETHEGGKTKLFAWTLDRKDFTKGYTTDNVVVCAYIVNTIKNYVIEQEQREKYISSREDYNRIAKILIKKFS